MAGYSRTDTTNNIADGNIINASDFDGEFDAIATAFGTSGHTHDGTAENGGAITKIGPSQDFVVSASLVTPKTTNTLDIGTDALEFKDIYIDGTAYIDGLGRDILVATDKKIQFRDAAIFLNSSTDGQLDIDADGTENTALYVGGHKVLEVDVNKLIVASGATDGEINLVDAQALHNFDEGIHDVGEYIQVGRIDPAFKVVGVELNGDLDFGSDDDF